MRYPPQLLDEIRARLPASQVVGRRVRLKKAGREWKGLSPFNAEKSPSFFVNDQKAFYHCFSSGKHGDIFTFLMETEGLSFPEAVERLAGEAGVPLPKSTAEGEAAVARRRSLQEVVELAARFFEETLAGRAGARARDYLARRGLAPETQRRFRLGYAPPERFALRDHLAAKDVSAEAMIEAGLLVAGDDVAVPYDRFRDRAIFPIADGRGRVIAFGGRAMSADVPAKYLNSPDTPLFQKGSLLYNAHQARKPAHERGTVIAVEGYVDVIALSAAGFENAVAPLGTALTEEQLSLLWRLADEPVLCFDGDKAGRRAAHRALDVALPLLEPGKSLRFALLPEGQDPDDLVRAGGAPAFDLVLAGAKPFAEMLWSREVEAGPLDTPDQRAALERRLREAVRSIRDETLRRHYQDDVRARIEALRGPAAGPYKGGRRREAAPFARIGLLARPLQVRPALLTSPRLRRGAGDPPREAAVVMSFVTHPHLLDAHAETLAELEFEGPDARALGAFLVDAAAGGETLDRDLLAPRLMRAGLDAAAERLAARVGPGDRWALDPHGDALRLEDALRQAIILHRKARALHSELRAAESALAEDASEVNFVRLCEVQGQVTSLDGAEADSEGAASGRALDGRGTSDPFAA